MMEYYKVLKTNIYTKTMVNLWSKYCKKLANIHSAVITLIANNLHWHSKNWLEAKFKFKTIYLLVASFGNYNRNLYKYEQYWIMKYGHVYQNVKIICKCWTCESLYFYLQSNMDTHVFSLVMSNGTIWYIMREWIWLVIDVLMIITISNTTDMSDLREKKPHTQRSKSSREYQ